jgi:AAA domain
MGELPKEEASTVSAAEACKEQLRSTGCIDNTNDGSSKGLNYSETTEFLTKLRSPPWLLIAIAPDKDAKDKIAIAALSVYTVEATVGFIRSWDGKRNLYYGVNPANGSMNKKPEKKDITAIEYALGDLDPRDDESAEDAKARYLGQLNGAFQPKPTAIVDSGNGIQCLWKLAEPIVLGEDRATVIANVEDQSKVLMERLGAKAGTQNIDRILRLPGTKNLPNEVKRQKGRVACPTKTLVFTDTVYPIEALNTVKQEQGHKGEHVRASIDIDALPVSDRIKNLIRGINDPEHVYESRSEAVFAVVIAMLKANCPNQQIQDVMSDVSLPIGGHVRAQSNPTDYLVRQMRHALAKIGGPTATVREVKIKARMEDVLKSAEALRCKKFDPLRWIVPKYLPEGLTLLAGRPKVGKSWQALDIATGVADGGLCFGEQCEQGDVLGLFLEDNDRRLQRRLTQMFGGLGGRDWPARLTYATSWPRLNEGGLDWIREWISRSPNARLVVIDILERVRQVVSSKDKRSAYSADYEALIALHELASEAMISILVLHHQRKLGADDLIDTVSGTLGLGGAVDSVLILAKEQKKNPRAREPDPKNLFLWGRGRDLEDFNVSVRQNDQMRFEVMGLRRKPQPTVEREAIVSMLAGLGGDIAMSLQEIVEACKGDYDNVKNLLSKLCKEGFVTRTKRGMYILAEPEDEIPF